MNKSIFKSIVFTVLVISLTVLALAQAKVPEGSKIFVAPMKEEFNNTISEEIVKKKLPVTVVTDEQVADFIITGSVTNSNDKWYNAALGGKDQKEGSIRLISVKEKQLIWVGEAGDKGFLWGSLSKSGQRKMAERLVLKMKKDLFKGK